MPGPWRRITPDGTKTVLALMILASCVLPGCGRTTAKPEPDAKVRLTKVLRLYQVYVAKNKKGPTDEQTLHEFGQSLTPQQRDEYMIGDDLDTIFASPRDNQKFVIVYGLKLDPGGSTRAVAWEAVGQGGKRFVALSMGYVEEYDDSMFNKYKK